MPKAEDLSYEKRIAVNSNNLLSLHLLLYQYYYYLIKRVKHTTLLIFQLTMNDYGFYCQINETVHYLMENIRRLCGEEQTRASSDKQKIIN